MMVVAQSVIVEIAPYLHIGYSAAATPPLELGLALVVVTAFLAPVLMAVMLFWNDEARALLRMVESFLFGLPWRMLCFLTKRTRGPP